ncbi:hypothetical protein HN873_009609, partial [Arachis hypogaea]
SPLRAPLSRTVPPLPPYLTLLSPPCLALSLSLWVLYRTMLLQPVGVADWKLLVSLLLLWHRRFK